MSVKGQKRPEKEKKHGKKKQVTNSVVQESPDREKTGPILGAPTTAIESELELLSSELELPVDIEKLAKEQEATRLRAILPSWCNKPWMYVTPTNPNQLSSWNSAWGDFLLEYAEVKAAHILNLLELRKEFPFSNRIIKKKLSIGQLQQIGLALIEKNFATWWDERQTRLRIYWRGLDEWSESIYEWAFRNGFEVVSLFELVNVTEIWSTLPHEELLQILQMIVKQKRAKWVGKDKKTVLFHF